MNRKKPPKLSEYTKDLLKIIDKYIAVTGTQSPDLLEVAGWAYHNGLMAPMQRDVVRQLASDLRRASARDYIVDENGEAVRNRLAYREKRDGKQLCFWFKMEDATPEKMRLNAAWRRKSTLQDFLQLHRDVKYYNAHINPGDPIRIDPDFTTDVEEYDQPSDYTGGDDDDPDGQPV